MFLTIFDSVYCNYIVRPPELVESSFFCILFIREARYRFKIAKTPELMMFRRCAWGKNLALVFESEQACRRPHPTNLFTIQSVSIYRRPLSLNNLSQALSVIVKSEVRKEPISNITTGRFYCIQV